MEQSRAQAAALGFPTSPIATEVQRSMIGIEVDAMTFVVRLAFDGSPAEVLWPREAAR